MRGVRPHDERAGSALPAPEGEAPVLAGPAQVLRQAPLQVHQLAVCEQPARLVPDAGAELDGEREMLIRDPLPPFGGFLSVEMR